MPRNIETILGQLKLQKKECICCVQFCRYDNKGKGFSSGSLELAEAVNKNKNITVDVGQVMFKPTLTISSDVLRQFGARNNVIQKWIINEIEDGGGGTFLMNIKLKIFIRLTMFDWIRNIFIS